MASVDVPLKRVRFGHTARKDGWWVMPLVTFVVFLFLQNWRATMIPMLAVPV